MSLEMLISKYIDGELTTLEDAKLRSILKENPYAKEKFDSSVELHMDLLDDRDSIQVPKNLLKQTEEAVLMRIFSTTEVMAAPQPVKKAIKLPARIATLAAVVSFFALISYLNFGDKEYPRIIDISMIESPAEIIVSSNETALSSKNTSFQSVKSDFTNIETTQSDENSIVLLDNDSQEIAELIPEIEEFLSDISHITTETTESNIAAEKIKPSEDNQPLNMMSDKIHVAQVNSGNNSNLAISNIPQVNFGFTGPEVTSIQLNTIVSRDFSRAGIQTSGNSHIINMSQSIGYSLSSKSVLGIEFGITEFNYDYIKIIPVGGSAGHSSGFSINEPIGDGGSGGGTLVNLPVRLERQQQFFWGMAFFDNNIYDYDRFSLNGRIGFGATNDGPLGLGRITARYNILSSIAFTLGAEGRFFMVKTPLLENKISTVSSYGFVYGIQLNL
ncbi:MAG: hypothetical protein KIT33_02930 [Candidatus Kapabacteria bacterium]|nr:hypothetical protein [Ignavibacteriota bacterium]MCW5883904.1 hypothetical protein [Candidatus Kapabacteria bacterium]